MTIVDIHEAKVRFSELIDLVCRGEDVIISRDSKPIVRLTKLEDEKRPILFGSLEGQGSIADDFDTPLPEEVQETFERP